MDGGSTDRELIELTVSPNRPPGPSVATIPTVETAFRMAARKELLSTIPTSPVGEVPRADPGRLRIPGAKETRREAATASPQGPALSMTAFFNVSAIQ